MRSNLPIIVGNGNLAWHLSAVLPGEVRVISRDPEARAVGSIPVLGYSALSALNPTVVFLAVPDDRIAEVSGQLSRLIPSTVPVIHTSGATPCARIDAHFAHRGVMWPVRSLRRGEAVTDWRDLPLVIYGLSPTVEQLLREVAARLSDTVAWLDDTQRTQLHLAAVFSNNFVTALYEIAFQLCADHAIPFELLLPIIRNTAQRQDGSRPAARQTGAAARGDTATMDRHVGLLQREDYRRLYRDISALILQYRLTEHDADLGGEADDDLKDEGVA